MISFLSIYLMENVSEEKRDELSEMIEEYYKRYAPSVYRRCKWLLRDDDIANDAMQDVFVQLLLKKNRPAINNASSYLFRMATNISLKIIQKNAKKNELNCDELLERIAFAEDIEEKTIVNDLLNKLFLKVPATTKEIAVMVYIDKMTLKEVADEVNMSVSGIKKRLNSLNRILRDLERK